MIREFDYKKDIEFIKASIQSESYIKFIRESTKKQDFENVEILIFEFKEKQYGFVELKDINYEHGGVTINIYMNQKSNIINSLAMFQTIAMLFKERKFHRISIKVKETNLIMRNILNKCGIFLEGVLFDDINHPVYLYSILDYEYDSIKNRILIGKK